MKDLLPYLLLPILLIAISFNVPAQISSQKIDKHADLSQDSHKTGLKPLRLQKKLDNKTKRYLGKLKRQDQRLAREITQSDSLAAQALFGDVGQQYGSLRERLDEPIRPDQKAPHTYSGRIDSVKTALRFLQQNAPDQQKEQLEASIGWYNQLQNKLDQTEYIKRHVAQRQEQLQAALKPYGMEKKLKGYKKGTYYFKEQLSEYRQLLEDPSRQEEKLLKEVRQIPAFKQYFEKESAFASFFGSPSQGLGSSPDRPIEGLQTVANLQQAFGQKFGADPEVEKFLKEKVQKAQDTFNQVKNKASEAGNHPDSPIPNFKPNSQKTKSFWKRLEIDSNMQTTRSSIFFPVTSDVGISVGYKMNDNSVVGLGGSYKAGLGQNIQQVQVSHQGVGFRSFLDYQLKPGIWVTVGAELHHRPHINSDKGLAKDYDGWQKMALLGITKKYKVNAKLQGNVQLLYDLLHQQMPGSQPVLFRVGYTFK